MPRLLVALALARGDGPYARLLKGIGRVQLLVLNDLGLAPLTGDQLTTVDATTSALMS